MKSQRKCTLFYISFIVLFIFYDALCFMKLLPFQFGNVISLKGRWSVPVNCNIHGYLISCYDWNQLTLPFPLLLLFSVNLAFVRTVKSCY